MRPKFETSIRTYCVSLVYISEYYKDDAHLLITEKFSVRLLITHARRRNYRCLIILRGTPSGTHRANYSARGEALGPAWSLFRIARIKKLIDHPTTMGKIPGRPRRARGWQSGAVTDTFVVGFWKRCAALGGLSWNCQFNNHFGFKSIFFDVRRLSTNGLLSRRELEWHTISMNYNCFIIHSSSGVVSSDLRKMGLSTTKR